MSTLHGRFVWYELMTPDTTAAETFYKGVIGWGARDSGVPDRTYTLLCDGETPVAGLMALSGEACAAGAKPGWIGYVAVDDVDESANAVAQAGGTIHHAADTIPGVGRFAVVADPQGAVLGLFKGSREMHGQPPSPGAPGHAGWRELSATDREAAFAFYSRLFGWTKAEALDMGPMGVYQLFASGGETIGGMMTRPDAVPTPFWLYYFTVEAIDAAVARVQSGGGQITNGPLEVPGGSWIVQCLDPQGVTFALVASRR